mgnify:CR=1 FL=1
MNKFIYIFVAIVAISFASCTQERAKEKELKVLSWNVWHAGHAKNYPEKGCEGTIGILRKSQADVILMIETYGAAPMVADSLGYDYVLLSDNLCIYSRYPIKKTYLFYIQFWRSRNRHGWHTGPFIRYLVALFT